MEACCLYAAVLSYRVERCAVYRSNTLEEQDGRRIAAPQYGNISMPGGCLLFLAELAGDLFDDFGTEIVEDTIDNAGNRRIGL